LTTLEFLTPLIALVDKTVTAIVASSETQDTQQEQIQIHQQQQQTHSKLAFAALQCLNTLTDNPATAPATRSQQLQQLPSDARQRLARASRILPLSWHPADMGTATLKLLSLSVRRNMEIMSLLRDANDPDTDTDHGDTVPLLLQTVGFCLEFDMNRAVAEVERLWTAATDHCAKSGDTAHATAEAEEGIDTDMAHMSEKAEKCVYAFTTHMDTLQLSLEVLAGVFTDTNECDEDVYSNDEDDVAGDDIVMVADMKDETMDHDDNDAKDDDEDDDDEDDDPMAYDAELAQQIQMESMPSGSVSGAAASTLAARFALLEKLDIMSKILTLAGCSHTSASTKNNSGSIGFANARIPSTSPFYSCVRALGVVRLRAFECLQNLFMAADTAGWFVSRATLAGRKIEVGQLWVWLFEAVDANCNHQGNYSVSMSNNCNDAKNATRIGDCETGVQTGDLMEAAVSAMWALARGLESAGMSSVLVQFFFSLYFF
jgi:hypothetical protein